MEVFWEHGYEGASLSELTAAMGINSPSLYAAFGCKEALFREAVALYNATEGSVMSAALRDEPMARDAVEAMLRNNAYRYTAPGKPSGCMIVLAATTCTPANSRVRAHLAECRSDARDALRHRFERGVVEGDLPAEADTAAPHG